MRAFFRFLINVALIALGIRMIVRFTSIDENLRNLFSGSGNGGDATQNGGGSGDVVLTDPNACTTPRGVKIPDGSSIFAYESPYVDSEGKCKEEIRICEKGVLQGTYKFGSCEGVNEGGNGTGDQSISPLPATGDSCVSPWGQRVDHGSYIVAYESVNSCTFQRRMCVDGELLGTFTSSYCLVGTQDLGYSRFIDDGQTQGSQQPGLDMQQAWQMSNTIVENPDPVYGGTNQRVADQVNYFTDTRSNAARVVSTQTIVNPRSTEKPGENDIPIARNQDLTQYDLTLKGCNTPWGTFVDHGQFVIAYRGARVGEGQSCTYERRNCFNGVLYGSYSFPSCSAGGTTHTTNTFQLQNRGGGGTVTVSRPPVRPTNNSCVTPRGDIVPNGGSVRAFQRATASWVNGCQGEVRYCRDGRLSGSYGYRSCRLTDPNPGVCYGNSCNQGNNRSCQLPWGGWIGNNQSTLAYAMINGQCMAENRTCTNGVLYGSYTMHWCQQSYNPQQSCLLPRGGTIGHNQSVTAYTSINGQCYSENRLCQNGYLGGSYSQSQCYSWSNPGNGACSLPWGGSIPHGEFVEAYRNSSSPCTKEIRRCQNGFLQGSFTFAQCYAVPPVVPPSPPSPPPQPVDTYGRWSDLGRMSTVPNATDTCNGQATTEYVCGSTEQRTCVDVRKEKDDCCIAGRAKYEQRTVTCVR